VKFNASTTKPFRSFQIWVYPKQHNLAPRHEKFSYQPQDKLNKVLLALSPDRRNGSALINQDAFFSLSKLQEGKSPDYIINLQGNGVYIHCVGGEVLIEGYLLKSGDALGIYEAERVSIKANEESDLIFVEVPMDRGIRV
jgi:redox-sensitive bicupin YhaK (pirin superfamily)